MLNVGIIISDFLTSSPFVKSSLIDSEPLAFGREQLQISSVHYAPIIEMRILMKRERIIYWARGRFQIFKQVHNHNLGK